MCRLPSTFAGRSRRTMGRNVARPMLVLLVSGVVSACTNTPPVLTQLLEARRLASDLHVQFSKAADASNRAVMGDTDVAAAAAADEAKRARQLIERDVETLRPILQSLGYDQELAALVGFFVARFDEYRRLDDEILPLAGENTNVKAQRLSFGAAQQAADAFRTAIDAVTQYRTAFRTTVREALGAQAVVAGPRNPGPGGASHCRRRRLRDDANGTAHDIVRGGGRAGRSPGWGRVCVAGRRHSASDRCGCRSRSLQGDQRRDRGPIPSATAMYGRWPFRWAKRARSPQHATINCECLKRRWQHTSLPGHAITAAA